MSNFNIQELVEHVESTQQEIRGRWYPVRPRQLTGLGGLKLRIKGAIQVLLGKADTVEWSLRPIKVKKVTEPKDMKMCIAANVLNPMPVGFDHASLRVHSYVHPMDIEPTRSIPKPSLIPIWEPVLDGEFVIGTLQTGASCRIELRYNTKDNTMVMYGPRVVDVSFKVK